MNKKRKIKDNLYKIKIENVFILIISNIICFLIFEILRYKIPNIINIHLNCNFEIDYIALYSCILSLVLPLAILLIKPFGISGIWISICVSSILKGISSYLIYEVKIKRNL